MSTETGGTRGVLKGNLKRRMVSCTIATMSPGEAGSGVVEFRGLIKGMSSVLNMCVAVGGYIGEAGSGNDDLQALPPTSWPAGAGTIQIIPQSRFGDSPPLQFREVFQDPTAVTNANFPLPEDLPFSWNFPGEADEAVIISRLDRDAWQGSGLTCKIVMQVWAEYFGPWWDVDAYVLAMGQVAVDPPSTKPVVFTT
jgi:hypothetical protein